MKNLLIGKDTPHSVVVATAQDIRNAAVIRSESSQQVQIWFDSELFIAEAFIGSTGEAMIRLNKFEFEKPKEDDM